MGLAGFFLQFRSVKNLAKDAKELSSMYDIPLDESILDNKEKLIQWYESKETNKIYNEKRPKSSSLNTDVNPSTGLPMIDGCIDVGGNSYGS